MALMLTACGELHGGQAAAVQRHPLPAATATSSVAPSAAVSASPAPFISKSGFAFSGAFTGTMLNPTVICEQHVPQGGQGFMSATGMVGGEQRIVTIWSASANRPQEIYEGSQPGQIDYGQITGSVTGISGFDWARGATVVAQLPAVKPTTGPPLQVVGTFVCP